MRFSVLLSVFAALIVNGSLVSATRTAALPDTTSLEVRATPPAQV